MWIAHRAGLGYVETLRVPGKWDYSYGTRPVEMSDRQKAALTQYAKDCSFTVTFVKLQQNG